MSNDYIAPIIARLTYNGASNLVGTIEHPSEDHADLINGGRRLSTGLGKWTHIAALGVKRNLTKLGLAKIAVIESDPYHRAFPKLLITPLGREVATYLKANWDDIAHTLQDKTREATGR